MKTCMALVIATAVAAASGGAAAQSDAAAQQRAAMDKIAWMAGQWEGSSSTFTREGEMRAVSSESVQLGAGGTALLVRGRHWRQQADGTRGAVVHDAAGLIRWDAASGSYKFTTQLADGRGGVYDGVVDGGTFTWRLPLPQGYVRYDIARNDKGQWSEQGFFCAQGAECRPIFRMTLDRKGDAP